MIVKTAPCAGVGVLFALIPLSLAHADPATVALPDITVTADRVEEPASRSGSSLTIVPAEQIDKYGIAGVADALREVPGLDVVDSGGAGSLTTVNLRGGGAGHTLVMIDGVRIGDPTFPDGSLDFGNLSAVNIERIEVLRGPQSALYGSDAMGGVINIITRKGAKTPQRSVTIEAGSYGTISARASLSGGDDLWTYSLGVNLFHADGFPRYGYRINRPIVIGDGVTPLPPLPRAEPTDKGGVGGRFSYRASDIATIDFGFNLQSNALRYDNPFATMPSDVFNSYNHSKAFIADGFVKATIDPWNGLWKHQFTVFGNVTKRDIWETEGCFDANFNPFNCKSGFQGGRFGGEYQGDANFGSFGALTYGARTETETATTSQDPNPNDGSFTPISARQITNSLFAEYRYTAFERLDLTAGGRVDAIQGGSTFTSGRATAAYRFEETGTKARASYGTGAKAPTLFQRFSLFGTAGLQPETNWGYDFGIDQKILGDRATVSATFFSSDYKNLIGFANLPACSPAQILNGGGCYFNVNRARTQGVEVSMDASIVPDTLRAKASYTYTDTRDLVTRLQMLRVPYHKGSFSVTYDPTPRLEIEPRVLLVGAAFDNNTTTFQRVTLSPYAKFDLLARYKINANLSAFGRIDNLTDARYEEVYNYGTAGRGFYAGLNYTW